MKMGAFACGKEKYHPVLSARNRAKIQYEITQDPQPSADGDTNRYFVPFEKYPSLSNGTQVSAYLKTNALKFDSSGTYLSRIQMKIIFEEE